LNLTTTDPLNIVANTQGFRISGPVQLAIEGSSGAVQISGSIDVRGTPGGDTSCATASAINRLLGFEDSADFSSAQALLSTVSSPRTQGCAALGVRGQGYMTINTVSFSTTSLPPVTPNLRVDLFIPTNQPNPSWLGALQAYLSCPSANLNNVYLGQVELTGKPVGAFATLPFSLSSSIVQTLKGSFSDCSFSFALNVNQTGQTWILDNLRFVP